MSLETKRKAVLGYRLMQTWRAGANPEGFTGDQIAKLNEEAKPEEIRLITD